MPSVFTLTSAEPSSFTRHSRRVRRGQKGMTPSGKRWGRQFHEEQVIRELQYISQSLRWGGRAGQCSPDGVYMTVKLNQAIARARTQLAGLGPDSGPRTRKLWGAVGRAQKRVDKATNELAKCLLRR